MTTIIESVLGLAMKYMENKDAKEQVAYDTVQMMLRSKTYKFVDAVVKLAYASEQITKGLVRPLFSAGLFVWGMMNPEILVKLKELGAAGDVALLTVFGAAPAWGVSRHVEKKQAAKESDVDSILNYKG